MIKQVGIVIEIFNPNNDISNNQIGFKVLLYSGVEEIIKENNPSISNINKGNMVILKKESNYSKKFTDIELFTGDNY